MTKKLERYSAEDIAASWHVGDLKYCRSEGVEKLEAELAYQRGRVDCKTEIIDELVKQRDEVREENEKLRKALEWAESCNHIPADPNYAERKRDILA